MENFKPVRFEDREKIYSLLSGIPKSENGFWNEFAEMNKEEFLSKGIQLLIDWSEGKNLYENFVPVTFYFLYDNSNNIVGVFKLRHYLNEHFRKGAGHISFAIKKDYRNKGYAKLGLHLAIKTLDKILPEEEKLVKVVCQKENIGSFLTIQGNLPLISNIKEMDFKVEKYECCESFIDRKNRIVIKTLNEKNINNIKDDEYLKNNIKNTEIKIFGAYLDNSELIGYIALQKNNKDYEVKNLTIIKINANLVYGLFNYAYAVSRVDKIKNILIDELIFGKLEKEFSIKEKFDYKILENKIIQINVEQL